MPKLIVNIAGIGSPLSDGGSSKTGHMWYQVTDSNGNTNSYGFAPIENGVPHGPGTVWLEDSSHYLEKLYTQEVEISDAQYDLLKSYGTDPTTFGFDKQYDGIYNSCVDFTWKALEVAGLNPGGFEGDILPGNNIDDLKEILGPGFGGNTEWAQELNDKLIKNLKDAFATAETTRSPIVLDLDGDGIETIGLNDGVHFDHDGNGFAEATGWVAKDDGMLVWDRNANGTIDNGKELFGNNTLLAAGEKASNGFLALASVDGNNDGVIDDRDAIFNELRVWVDRNSDGVSQADELLSLYDAGVRSLNTSYSEPGQPDANGDVPTSVIDDFKNEHRQVGSYVRTDGTTGISEDIWFTADGADTVDLSTVEITSEIAKLANLDGFGNVHGLHEAMALDTTGELQDLIVRFSAEMDPNARRQLMVSIMYHWAGVEDIDPNSRAATQVYGNVIGDARKLATLEAFLGENYLGTWCWGERDANPHGAAAPILLQAFDNLMGVMYSKLMLQTHLFTLWSGVHITTSEQGITWDTTEIISALHSAYTANEVSGLVLMSEFGTSLKDSGGFGQDLLQQLRIAGNAAGSGFEFYLTTIGMDRNIGTAQNDVLNGSSLADILIGQGGDDTIYGGGGDDRLIGSVGNDYLAGGDGADTYEFGRGDGKDTILNADVDAEGTHLDKLVFDTSIQVSDVSVQRNYYDLILTIKNTNDSVTIQSYFDEDGLANRGYTMDQIVFGDGTIWTMAQIYQFVTIVTEENDLVWGSYANDVVNGRGGNDTLYGLVGNDKLEGDIGDDWLDGGTGNDQLIGGEGNDTLIGGAGDDYLEGGVGADRLQGGIGKNTFFYRRGDGEDIIVSSGDQDRIQFDTGVQIEQLSFTRDRYSLFITDAVTGQRLTIDHLFDQDNHLTTNISISVSDGQELSISEIVSKSMLSTSDSDFIYGYITDDVILAGSGDDIVTSGDGNDVVYGDDGNDQIYGDNGNDYLYGGEGNDWLNGGLGADVLDGGSGDDTLILSGPESTDTIIFGPGYEHDTVECDGNETFTIKLTSYEIRDAVLTRDNYNLVLSFANNSDTLTLKNIFSEDAARYGFTIEDALGSTLFEKNGLLSQFPYAITVTGTDNSDYLNTSNISERILGNGGDDNIFAAGGDDWIEGGLGNDYLAGGAGNDTYLYHEGDGADVIDSGFGGTDTLIIDDTISSSRITVHRSDTNLVIRIDGNKDQSITISGYYNAGNPTLSKITYGGVEHTIQEIAQLAIADTVNDMIQGSTGDDVLIGGFGNDTLYGASGNDLLIGGAGDDFYLYTGPGAMVVDDIDGANDKVAFYNGATVGQILAGAKRNENDLVIDSLNDGINTVTVKGFFSQNNTIDAFMVMTGESISSQQIANYLNEILPAPSTDSPPPPTPGGTYIDISSNSTSIFGSSYNDHIVAGGGNNIIQGRAGDDFIKGGSGSDTYIFNKNDGHDILDNSGANTTDTDILMASEIRYDNLWFSQSSSDLIVDLIDNDDSITIKNWFADPNNQLDAVNAKNYSIDAASVNALVQAMASFGPALGGDIMNSLSTDQRNEVHQIMAANWTPSQGSGGGVPT
ncbi:MAG: calcium-binding protein [Pseudomonas sp.]